MLIRVFKGRARPGLEKELETYTREVALPEFRAAPGLIAAHFGAAVDDPDGSCTVVTMWEDLDSLKAFTGPNWQEVMTSPDERSMLGAASVTHFVLSDEDDEAKDVRRNGRTIRPRHHQGGARALVIAGPATDVPGIVEALKRRGFPALIAPTTASAASLLTRWKPDVAIVGTESPGADGLLSQLERIDVPVLLVGDAKTIANGASHNAGHNVRAAVASPAGAEEIASAVEIVIGRPLLQGLPELLDAGPVRIDVTERIAYIDDEPIELPPKEFALLAELASHPGQPIPSGDLAARLWPESAWVTGDDVRRTVYRLRKLIGDDDRTPPLIRNRRGYGYVLEPRQGAGSTSSVGGK